VQINREKLSNQLDQKQEKGSHACGHSLESSKHSIFKKIPGFPTYEILLENL
jgi:hypothetical protein